MRFSCQKNSLSILLLTFVGFILGAVEKLGYFDLLNLRVSQGLQAIQPQWFIEVSKFVSSLELVIIFLAPALLVVFLRKRQHWIVRIILLSSLSWVVVTIFKSVFSIARPFGPEVETIYVYPSLSVLFSEVFNLNLEATANSSYPSGHVFNYVSFWGVVYYLTPIITSSYFLQKVIKINCVLLILLVGVARISLGAHWFIDVIGGYLLGFAWLILAIYSTFQDKSD
ncbi:MAG: phosphatase PAP2 family protein [Patescibacteria group bacterium]|jgi:membrane-associated phospholipid phosphatase